MSRPEWISLLALVLAIGAILVAVVAVVAVRRVNVARASREAAAAAASQPQPAREVTGEVVAFVANPTKPGATALRDAAILACAARNMPEPLWYETTVADPGLGQARAAIERGAGVVVAVGGDGTVRAVAEALAGTQVPMGLIPQGTGNLLARNLDLPLTDGDSALRIALTGAGRAIDVGWLRIERDGAWVDDVAAAAADVPGAGGQPDGAGPDDTGSDSTAPDGPAPDRSAPDVAGSDSAPANARKPPRDHIFLVIAGLGFDAAMVADTDEVLKARVGWIAYFVAGARHLHGRRLRLELRLDDAPPTPQRVRSLLIGNCGRLPGGITLLPDAVLDDGWLDVGVIDTRGGLMGWAQLLGEVVLQGVGLRNELPGKIGRIDHSRVRNLNVIADRPEAVQVDGDVLGKAQEIAVRVDPGALIVRVNA